MRKYSQKVSTNIKNMTYVTHPDNYPLEINGKMRNYKNTDETPNKKESVSDFLNNGACYNNFYSTKPEDKQKVRDASSMRQDLHNSKKSQHI